MAVYWHASKWTHHFVTQMALRSVLILLALPRSWPHISFLCKLSLIISVLCVRWWRRRQKDFSLFIMNSDVISLVASTFAHPAGKQIWWTDAVCNSFGLMKPNDKWSSLFFLIIFRSVLLLLCYFDETEQHQVSSDADMTNFSVRRPCDLHVHVPHAERIQNKTKRKMYDSCALRSLVPTRKCVQIHIRSGKRNNFLLAALQESPGRASAGPARRPPSGGRQLRHGRVRVAVPARRRPASARRRHIERQATPLRRAGGGHRRLAGESRPPLGRVLLYWSQADAHGVLVWLFTPPPPGGHKATKLCLFCGGGGEVEFISHKELEFAALHPG